MAVRSPAGRFGTVEGVLAPRLFLVGLAAASVLLTACASNPTTTPSAASATPSATASPSVSPSPSVDVSTNLDAITVTGDPPKAPKVTFDAPFAIDTTHTEVLNPGKGAEALADGWVEIHYQGTNGRTGEVFDESYSRKTPAVFPLSGVIPGFKTGLTGQRAGSRVLIGIPGAEAYDAMGGSPDAGIEVGDTLLFVVDILSVSLNAPSGKAVTPPAGLPTVSEGTGKPTITIPAGQKPPTEMVSQTLIQGAGNKVAAADTIVVHYQGVSWKTGKVIEDVYDAPDSGQLSATIPGWQKGLVGKRVGSRVLLVLPPEDAYPQGSNNPPVEAGDTLVYVVDLLFAYAA